MLASRPLFASLKATGQGCRIRIGSETSHPEFEGRNSCLEILLMGCKWIIERSGASATRVARYARSSLAPAPCRMINKYCSRRASRWRSIVPPSRLLLQHDHLALELDLNCASNCNTVVASSPCHLRSSSFSSFSCADRDLALFSAFVSNSAFFGDAAFCSWRCATSCCSPAT